MTETTLKDVLEEICAEEVYEYEQLKCHLHLFSPRHRKAMKEILYPNTGLQFSAVSSKQRRIPIRKRILIATMAIVMAVMCVTAGGAMIRGFNRKVYPDYTMLLAANAQNCPKTIENVYYLSEIPEGYEQFEQISDSLYVYKSYINPVTNKVLTLEQYVKEGYRSNFDNERYSLEEIDINGKYALYLGRNNEGAIVWDNEDYILKIFGKFTKEELIFLAKNAKI